MSAYLELQSTGRVGPEFYGLLMRTVAAAVRAGRYPPPDGNAWRPDDIRDVAHGFLTDANALRRLTGLHLRAVDDVSLGRLVWTAVVNLLRDRARRTDRGAFHRKLDDLIARDDNDLDKIDTPAGQAVTLPGMGHEPWNGDERQLAAAAYDVDDVRILRWRSAARRSPLAQAASLVEVMAAIVGAADAPVLLPVLQRAMETRFTLAAPPVIVDIDDEPLAGGDDPADVALTREAAADVFDQLTERERTALAYFDLPVRELSKRMDVSKSTAGNVRARLEAILTSTLIDDDDPEATLAELREVALDWTRRHGPTSEENGP